MFRIASPDATWTHPVRVQVPAGDGRTTTHVFTAKFKLLKASQTEALLVDGDAALLREALVGWGDIQDADGDPLEFSPEARETLLDVAYWRRATVVEYLRFASGLPEKNSGAPRVN